MKLPDRISSALNYIVEELKNQESISGVGLFGSWSRGDAVVSSDVDLLILDKRSFDYEYVERIELENVLFDLDYVPVTWMIKGIPPEVDQKVYEAEILYDRDKVFAVSKDWMLKAYWMPERVDIRTERYLMEADTYLSRASSAYNREDFQSTILYSIIGLDAILKTLIEIDRLPISNSHFIEAVLSSTRSLEMLDIYDDYLKVGRLFNLNQEDIENRLNSLKAVWDEASSFIKEHDSTLENIHIRVKNSLNYYGKPGFLKGMLTRVRALTETEQYTEAAHYMLKGLFNLLENYAFLTSSVRGTKYDYTTLIRSFEESEETSVISENAVRTFGLETVSPGEAEFSLGRAKEITLKIRNMRKKLIRERLKPLI